MKCKNCGHKLEEAVDDWKKEGKKYYPNWSGYWHFREHYAVGSLGFRGRRLFNYLKKCHCSCTKPEPEVIV
jgi:hypothetical protein